MPYPAAPVDQQRRGQFQRLGDADRNRAGRLEGDGVGRRIDRARNHERKQRRRLELHHGGPVGRPYAFTATDTTSAGTSAASSALKVTVPLPAAPVDQQRRGQFQRLGDTDRNGARRRDGDGVGRRIERARNREREQRRRLELHYGGLAAGAYAFTATDTTSAGTSAASSALKVTVSYPAAPVLSSGVVNSNDSVTLTGTAPAGATVTASDGGASALGTTNASSAGAWSFTTADLSAGPYAFTATDATSAGTSATSNALDLTVNKSVMPSVPIVSKAVENSNDSVTVTGTALVNSVVNLSCNGGAIAKLNVSSSGKWSYTRSALSTALYWYTATDTTSGGTSAASKPLYIEFAPRISGAKVNSNESVTLNGIAANGSGITV